MLEGVPTCLAAHLVAAALFPIALLARAATRINNDSAVEVVNEDRERLDEYKQRDEEPPSLHSPKFYPDPERSITTGVVTLTATALELLRPISE